MKAFLYRVCAIFFSHFVLYPDYRISFFIPLAFRFADYMNILIQLGSTESIKLFLGNMDAVAIVSIRAVTNELKSGLLKVIDIKDINIERIFSFVMPAGQYGGLEENFIHYAERSGWSMS